MLNAEKENGRMLCGQRKKEIKKDLNVQKERMLEKVEIKIVKRQKHKFQKKKKTINVKRKKACDMDKERKTVKLEKKKDC